MTNLATNLAMSENIHSLEEVKEMKEVKELKHSFNIADITKNRADIFAVVGAIIELEHCVINGNKYILKDGWRAIAGACGLFPEIVKVEEVWREDKFQGFNAVAILKDNAGCQISRAEGFCGVNEKFKDEYAVRAMAQTRAINRVCSNGLSFIVVGTGYKSTPAEEMKEEYVNKNCVNKSYTNKNYPAKKNKKENLKENLSAAQKAIQKTNAKTSNFKPTKEDKQIQYFFSHHKKHDELTAEAQEIWKVLKGGTGGTGGTGKINQENLSLALPLIKAWGLKVKQIRVKQIRVEQQAQQRATQKKKEQEKEREEHLEQWMRKQGQDDISTMDAMDEADLSSNYASDYALHSISDKTMVNAF